MIVINAEKPIPPKEVKPVERAFKEKFQFKDGQFPGIILGKMDVQNTPYYGEFQSIKNFTYGGKSVLGLMNTYNDWGGFTNHRVQQKIYLRGRNNSGNKQTNTKIRFYLPGLLEDTVVKRMRFISNLYEMSRASGDIRITLKFVTNNTTIAEKIFSTSNNFDIDVSGKFLFKKEDDIFFEIHYSYMTSSVIDENSMYVPYLEDFRIELYP